MHGFKIVGMSQHEGYCTADLILHDRDQTEVVAHDLFGSWMIGEPKKKTPQREPLALGVDPSILQAHKLKLNGDSTEEEKPTSLPKPKVPKFKNGSKVEILEGVSRANRPGPMPTRVHMDEVELMDVSLDPAALDQGFDVVSDTNHVKVDALAPGDVMEAVHEAKTGNPEPMKAIKRVPRKKAPVQEPKPDRPALPSSPKKRLPRVKT